jgi:mediator of RNA polymerase II transcription subunit 18
MHELLLYGQVSKARHEQVVKILAGVAAMQPRRVLKRHVVYKPQREPEEPGLVHKRGGTQSIAAKNTKQAGKVELYFTQLVQRLTEEDFGSAASTEQPSTVEGRPKWTYEFNDLPEAGNRGGALVRMTNSTDIVEGDPHAYVNSLGNQ